MALLSPVMTTASAWWNTRMALNGIVKALNSLHNVIFYYITLIRYTLFCILTTQQRFCLSKDWIQPYPLQWRHNGHDSVSNHQLHHCLLNRLFRRGSKKTSKLRVTGLCVGNSPGAGEFPAQMASNTENVSIWWRHHVKDLINSLIFIGIPQTKRHVNMCTSISNPNCYWWDHCQNQDCRRRFMVYLVD